MALYTDKLEKMAAQDLILQQRYRIIKLIDRGSMGGTFLALDEAQSPAILCIVKQFRHPNSSPEAIAQLKNLIQNPQIPKIIAYFEENNQFYLVQEFIEGNNLEVLLKEEGTFSESQIWQLLDDLLPVLKFIHDRQIIHRDIKPANIIRQNRNNKHILVDFGAAKFVTNLESLQIGTSIGSAEYVSPEQAQGKAVFASDLYSLGVSCIYLLTGIAPFDLFDAANDRWVWRDYLRQEVSDRLWQILDKLLQNSLSRRFQSADEVMLAMGKIESRSPKSIVQKTCQWECIRTLNLSAAINAIAISPDHQILASGGNDKQIQLWELKTGRLMCSFAGHTNFIRSLAFSPDGKILASGSDDKTIKFWDLVTQREICTLSGHSHAVKSIAFSAKFSLLASGSGDKTIKLWDVGEKKEILTLSGHALQVSAIAFSPDGQFLASASFDRTARLWDYNSLERPLRYPFVGHLWPVLAIAFSPDGKLLATGSDDNTIKLWNADNGQLLRTISGHSWSVVSLAFTPDGEILVSGSWDKTVKLWQVSTGEEIETLVGHSDSVSAIAIASNGQILVSSSKDKTIKLWQRMGGLTMGNSE